MTLPFNHDTVTPCITTDPELFFPEPDRGQNYELIEQSIKALKMCANCDVRQKCLDYSMQVMETVQYGIYGGTLPLERKIAAGYYVNPERTKWENNIRRQAIREGIPTPYIEPLKEKPKPCIDIQNKLKVYNERHEITEDYLPQEF